MDESIPAPERARRRMVLVWNRASAGACSVHLSLYFGVEEIGRADLREHIHRPRIDQQSGGILDSATAICSNVVRDSALD